MSQNRLAYTPFRIVILLENLGFYYVGCNPVEAVLEEGEFCEIEYYSDWQIQTHPCFAIAHTPTGHYWMPWGDAPEDVDFIKRIIQAGNELSLEKSFESEA